MRQTFHCDVLTKITKPQSKIDNRYVLVLTDKGQPHSRAPVMGNLGCIIGRG